MQPADAARGHSTTLRGFLVIAARFDPLESLAPREIYRGVGASLGSRARRIRRRPGRRGRTAPSPGRRPRPPLSSPGPPRSGRAWPRGPGGVSGSSWSRGSTGPRGSGARSAPIAPTSSIISSGSGDAGGRSLTDQPVASGRVLRGHRPRHGGQMTVQRDRVPRGVERPAAHGRLDHHGAPRQRGDEPVADQEPRPGRVSAHRALAHQHALRANGREQLMVRAGVGDVGAAGEHGDGRRLACEGAAVGRPVDAVRAARDDRPLPLAQPGSELRRDMRAIGRGGPRTDDRDGPEAGEAQVGLTVEPEGVGPGISRSSSWVGHSGSPGTTSLAPPHSPSARSLAGSAVSSRADQEASIRSSLAVSRPSCDSGRAPAMGARRTTG